MIRSKLIALAVLTAVLLPATGALAQAAAPATPEAANNIAQAARNDMFSGKGVAVLGAMIGVGLVLIGAGRGIGAIGSHAVDAMARQPEAADRIQGAMIVSAALIEGVALFGVVVCLLAFFLF